MINAVQGSNSRMDLCQLAQSPKSYLGFILCMAIGLVGSSSALASDEPLLPQEVLVSAPVDTEYVGKSGPLAIPAVVRILNKNSSTQGTGFLHKSGRIVTAAHVVDGATEADLLVGDCHGRQRTVKSVAIDRDLDLALLSVEPPFSVPPFPLSTGASVSIGRQVCTWGFPGGYGGLPPLLTVGYLSGVQGFRLPSGKIIQRIVVNAAFNSGNSGGPVIDISTGDVIGVVSSKLAPIPPSVEMALNALGATDSGTMYEKVSADGTKKSVSEAQVVADVLVYLRGQTQLVLGHAASVTDLSAFLRREKIEP